MSLNINISKSNIKIATAKTSIYKGSIFRLFLVLILALLFAQLVGFLFSVSVQNIMQP